MLNRIGPGVAVLALVLAACGDQTATTPGTEGEDPAGARPGTVDCGGVVYHPDDLSGAPDASTLPEGPAGAVDDAGVPAFDDAASWKVVHRSDERVGLIRELDEPYGGGDVRTHERMTLEVITGATNVPDGTWLMTSAGPCAQRVVAGTEPSGDEPPGDEPLGDEPPQPVAELSPADLTLAEIPSPDDTTIELYVHERECASGQSAEGRIELVELDITAEQVGLNIGVHRVTGGADCQGNPLTPYTVELDEPIGDREIVDIAVAPPRPVTPDAGE